jgi:hypothetical protein
VFLLAPLFEILGRFLVRLFGRWIDLEIESTDSTAADLLVRFSVAAGVIAFLMWLSLRLF